MYGFIHCYKPRRRYGIVGEWRLYIGWNVNIPSLSGEAKLENAENYVQKGIINYIITLYLAYSRACRGNLVLRHLLPHFFIDKLKYVQVEILQLEISEL